MNSNVVFVTCINVLFWGFTFFGLCLYNYNSHHLMRHFISHVTIIQARDTLYW
jgi:hypothetical protein